MLTDEEKKSDYLETLAEELRLNGFPVEVEDNEIVMNEAKTQISKKNVEVSSLKNIAIFLEGVKQGRGGNLLPLGNNDLEQLWNAIAFLQGDERFECRDLRH